MNHAFNIRKVLDDGANCISGGEWEYEFRQEAYIADICESYISHIDLTRQSLEVLESLSKAIHNELDTRADKLIEAGTFQPLNEHEICLVKSCKRVEAVRSYRDRNNCSVYFAKQVVDKYK